jgi:acylglycerol lipase
MRSIAVCLAVAACAAPSRPPLASVDAKPAALPSGVVHQQGSFEGARGLNLYEQSWIPAQKPRGVLVIMHGLKDHSSRYAGPAEALALRGYAVHAFDLRGHGRSEGDAVWVEDFEDYVADLALFVERVERQYPGARIFVFGHSMGGAIVTRWALTKNPSVAGLVLSAPALEVTEDVSGVLIGATHFFGTIAPSLAVFDLPNENFSQDATVVKDMGADPLVYQGNGPAQTASELLSTIALIQEGMDALALPFLALHGTVDKLTNPNGSRHIHERAKSADKTLKIYEGSWHDLLHEPARERVLADILAWLDAHTS